MLRFMKKQIVVTIISVMIVLTCVICLCLFRQETVLLLSDEQDCIAAIIPVEDNKFTLRYIHSVHKTPVYELYLVDANYRLVLTETRFDSLGVGMPFTAEEGTFLHENGQFIISGLHRVYQSIPLLISPIPEHAILTGANEYSFLTYIKSDSCATISAAKKWLLRWRA